MRVACEKGGTTSFKSPRPFGRGLFIVAMHPEEAAGGRFCRFGDESKSELARDLDDR